MAASTKKDGPDMLATSKAYQAMLPKWEMMEALLGGTETMRAAGEKYLPRYEAESAERYKTRLQMTTLLNMTKFTLNNLTGRVFKKPIVLHADVPELIRGKEAVEAKGKTKAQAAVPGYVEDIDGEGNHLQVVAYRWFESGFAKGLSHMLVDMPPKPTTPDGKPVSKAEDNRRPYWVPVAPENVLFAYSKVVDGKETLLQLHILEEYSELVDYAEVCDIQVRVLKPGLWEVWRYKEVGKGKTAKKEWYKYQDGEMGLPYIPFVTFYTKKKALMRSEVPLEDLANLNVSHWQSSSDQRNVLTAARFPILACSGSTGEDETTGKQIQLGPYNMLSTPDPQGKYYYVEHTGAAISAGRQDMRDLEDQMASYGAQFLKKKADIESATARILDSSETISELQAIALNFKDAVELALRYTADWMGLGDDAGGSIGLDAGLDLAVDGSDLQTLTEARRNRDISRKTYLGELKRRSVLSDDFDAGRDLEELSEENDLGMGEDDPEDDPQE